MPKRTDIQSILIIGAGPIVIGQACEFDYSGVQACKALREEGYRVILVNSNPATIMTDPEFSDAAYIEPIDKQTLEKIIIKESPDAILPTMGGQTALNCALELHHAGILEQHNVEMIGALPDAIDMAEDRKRFRQAMLDIGLEVPKSDVAHSIEEAREKQTKFGYPVIIRPSFTLGGSGGGIAYNQEEFIEICERGLDLSPTNEILLEESVLGWREFEMEVVRDKNDNCIIICSIENFDPMGIHTGDSITVAPAQTLTDKEYQVLRNASIKILRKIGVDTGGSNVQFGVSAKDGRIVVIEMNPRVSRSSALASKATGFPIAKIAAKLAIGYTLDELDNDITGGKIPASFEPTIDYVVTKIPRFTFEKFPGSDARLTTQMKSVGEAMGIGRNFQQSLQKALRSMEMDYYGLDSVIDINEDEDKLILERELREAGAERIFYVADAFRHGYDIDEIYHLTYIDYWFLAQIADLIKTEQHIQEVGLAGLNATLMRQLKRKGFADMKIAQLLATDEEAIRHIRYALNIRAVYKRVDSCAAEFEASTAYLYSCYDDECEATPSERQKIVILGGGPNRIGQGIEFDYCCVHAALALRDHGYETIMINCNPETVSTDYDTSDRLYFEPLTLEDVLEIINIEQPFGVIVHYGGQTPLKLADSLEKAGVPIIGTPSKSIDLAEDREQFSTLLQQLNIRQPANHTARSLEEALLLAREVGFPLIVRPSYVLGGRAMEIVYSESELERYMLSTTQVSEDKPILLDRFLDHATEIDIDAIADGETVLVCGIMEHIEEAGVHSGDSACCLPPHGLSNDLISELKHQTTLIAKKLGVVGLMNIQFAIQQDNIYVLEVNPRASRTTPFVSKALGMPLAKIAALCMAGISLKQQGIKDITLPNYYSVKEPIFPFLKFSGADPILGPEMRSTGEVMGIGKTFNDAFAKAQQAANKELPELGTAFISVRDADKERVIPIAKSLIDYGFSLVATDGTYHALSASNIDCQPVNKVVQGRPHIVDYIKNGEITFIVNTTEGRQAIADSYSIRREALQHKVLYSTTITGAAAFMKIFNNFNDQHVFALQELHKELMQ